MGSFTLGLLRLERQPLRQPVDVPLFRLVVTSLKRDLEVSPETLATKTGVPCDVILGQLSLFDLDRKDNSQRFQLGTAVLTREPLASAVLASSNVMVSAALKRLSNRLSATLPRGRRTNQPHKLSIDPKVRAGVRLPVWKESETITPAQVVDVAAPLQSANGVITTATTTRLSSWTPHDSNDDWDATLANPSHPSEMYLSSDLSPHHETAGVLETHKTVIRHDCIDWLCSLGRADSGIRIEPYSEYIIDRLSDEQTQRLNWLKDQVDDTGAALEFIWDSVTQSPIKNSARDYLWRLVRLHVVLRDGLPLPRKTPSPVYEPVPNRVLYLLHMRDPFEVNGYVSRTHLILAAMTHAGKDAIAVTRLGFPNDLARHRNKQIAEQDVLEGLPAIALKDSEGGLLRRSVDDYIKAYSERIVALAKVHKPTAIHAASNYLNGLAAIRAARILGIPAIYEVRGIWEITRSSHDRTYAVTSRYKLERQMENLAVNNADKVVTISKSLRQFVIDRGTDPRRASVLPNGVNTDQMRSLPPDLEQKARLGFDPDDVVVGYVGSVVRYEGLDYLIRALGRLKQRNQGGFRFLLIGDGPELSTLVDLAKEHEVYDLCHFAGRIPRADVEAAFAVVDMVVLPRRSLPVTEIVPPLKPFEAMSARKALIVSSVAAMAEIVEHGETGLVFEKDNVTALANAIQSLITDPQLRADLATAARDKALSKHSVPHLAAVIQDMYSSLNESSAF